MTLLCRCRLPRSAPPSLVVLLRFNRLASTLPQLQPQAQLQQNDNQVAYPAVKSRYPPGTWGGMKEKNAWKLYDHGAELLKIPKLLDRLNALSTGKAKTYWTASPFLKYHHALSSSQFWTKTRIVRSIPERHRQLASDDVNSKLFETAEMLLADLFAQEFVGRMPNGLQTDGHLTLLRRAVTLLSALCQPHNVSALSRCQIAERPEIEAAWHRWGFKYPDIRTTTNDEAGLRMRANYIPELTIRTEHPLASFVESVDAAPLASPDSEAVPDSFREYDPSCVGIHTDFMKSRWLPGFRHGDQCEFPFLQIIDATSHLGHMEKVHYAGEEDKPIVQELHDAAALLSGFTWTNAAAHFQGFSMFQDLTYPICVQTIILSDDPLTGQPRIGFSMYQLNTLSLFKDNAGNARDNICWLTGLQPLYTRDAAGAKLVPSQDVVRALLAFIRHPLDDRGLNKRPFLPDDPSPLLTAPAGPLNIRLPPEILEEKADEFWKV